ncbi:MAG: type II toxin-antitoxin system CcdA family antitoxin [Actinomycetota bacterium]|nr:type II toxin-antitoxin system CcdA family antitoxin [Actinomycetota bacterium]
MKKRRVTMNLDEDVLQALESVGGRSLSAVANDALRRAMATEAHRAALARWLDDLDDAHGRTTPEEARVIDALVDDLVQHSSDLGVA